MLLKKIKFFGVRRIIKYHRRICAGHNDDELERVKSTGELWGKAMRACQGNGGACVKALVGPLPDGVKGFTFITSVNPSASRYFFGAPGCLWNEDDEGVFDVPGEGSIVGIKVEVIT